MSTPNPHFSVRVLGADRKPLNRAKVLLQSEEEKIALSCYNAKGLYGAPKIPKGSYLLRVSNPPLASQERMVFVTGAQQEELFMLGFTDQAYYYRGKVKVPFSPDADQLAIVSRLPEVEYGQEYANAASQQLIKLAKKHKLKPVEQHPNLANNGLMLCRFPTKTSKKARMEICGKIHAEKLVDIGPVIEKSEGNASVLTNEIMVKFLDYVDENYINDLAKSHRLKVVKKMPVLGNFYHFTTAKVATLATLEISNKLAELPEVEFAEPNLIHTIEEDAITPTSFLFPEQWDHQLLNTPDAWQFLRNIDANKTFGDPKVIIGVIDSGVDTAHPEFSGSVSDGSAKIYQAFDFANMVANNNSLSSDHGTCCASAAAAVANNASGVPGTTEGVAGVAGNTRVIAVRRSGSEADYAEIYLWTAGFDPGSSTANFPAQITPGADIITSSYGFSVGSPISGTMQTVFDRLTDDGRDGKGTLLFFSAGNNNTDLDFDFRRPWGMYNRCFSVAASTLANDGVTEVKAGYSSFGSVIEFCAPSSDNGGVRVHNPTTGYGTYTATVRSAAPLQSTTISTDAGAGSNSLTLNNIPFSRSGVLTIVNGGNTETHMYATVTDAAGNRTNVINLLGPLANAQNSGNTVNFFGGFVPGNDQATDQLNGNVTAGTRTLTLDSTAGFSIGQGIMIDNPGTANVETNAIADINGNVITLAAPLFNAHPDNTAVSASAPNYRNSFGGTSHATPLAAGVAALMISANPDLSWTDVRDLLRETAVKINPGENQTITSFDGDGNNLGSTNGRWQDINGNFSNDPAYDGNPVFSEFYGFGRIDAAAAVREAGWDIELMTPNLNFNDVPTGEVAARAVRFNVKSRWALEFNMNVPNAPFFAPNGLTQTLGTSPDGTQVREVYLWVAYTGGAVGDQITAADGASITVTNPQTDQEWIIPITANTIERQSAGIMLALDKSGSMNNNSGIGTSKRIDVLRFSASILADVIQEGNGMGIVSYDADPHDELNFVGPLGPESIFDQDRADIKSAIINFTPTPNGLTAIGDGVERAQLRLNPVTDYDTKSIIVLTDGKETESKYIADVADQINDRVFAVGLGRAENIEPAALNAIVNNNGGYLLLTDDLGLDSLFKLAKYFLQILAGVNNEEVVLDPNGTIFPGQEHRIPFVINEADFSSDIILMLPRANVIDFHLETPDGQVLTPSDNNSVAGLTYSFGNNVAFYRLNLPLAVGGGAREGKWHAILKMNQKYGTSYLAAEESFHSAGNTVSSRGIPYTLLVHAGSNLNMHTIVSQEHFEPGAKAQLNVRLTQYGIPLSKTASVRAEVSYPDGQQKTIYLTAQGEGVYQTEMIAQLSGTYTLRIIANGESLRGSSFTREQVRTIGVWRGGNRPVPSASNPIRRPDESGNKEELCQLLSCLLSEKNLTPEFKKRMEGMGINIDGMIDCLRKYCRPDRQLATPVISAEVLKAFRQDYQAIVNAYEAWKLD